MAGCKRNTYKMEPRISVPALPALYAGYAHAYYIFVNIKSAKLVRLGVIIDEKFAFYTVGEVKFGLS